MKKNVFVFGSIAGLVFTVWMVAIYVMSVNNTNFQHSLWWGYGSMIAAFAFIFVGIINYRDKYNAGSITFGKAFLVGLYIALIGSTFYVVEWLIDFYCFMPDFMDKYVAHTLAQAKASGATAAQLSAQKASMASYITMYKNPFGVAMLTYMEVLPVGLVIALIAALILKRKRAGAEPAAA